MAELSMTTQYQSGADASIGVSGHEPNGDFWTYRVNDIDMIDNSMAKPDASDFHPFAKPDKAMPPSIAITPVDNIGVKKFIGWGAGAFYHPIDSEFSYLVLPIHAKLNEQEPPVVEITNNGNTVVFDVTQNTKIVYETVRLVVQQGNLREEKVVYFDKSGVIHYEMLMAFTGAVRASVRAHANEINVISELTEVELDLGDTLVSILPIKEKSAPLFNYDPDAIDFTDIKGMSIENLALMREVDGQYITGGISYEQEVFTSSGMFSVPSGVDKIDVLVVGGGGGGGGGGYNVPSGGGGAGGAIWQEGYSVTPNDSISVIVGNGGVGGTGGSSGTNGSNGQNSSFGPLVAIGGGGGAWRNQGNGGGSGGGGAYVASGGVGTLGQGFNGGASTTTDNAGGGGGYAQLGGNATSALSGNGGNGLDLSSVLGIDVGDNGWFAGGGGGGARNAVAAGSGGLGGGGAGGHEVQPPNAKANTGGGGGGTAIAYNGGSGGSGIVIVRYFSASGAIVKTFHFADGSSYGYDHVIDVNEV